MKKTLLVVVIVAFVTVLTSLVTIHIYMGKPFFGVSNNRIKQDVKNIYEVDNFTVNDVHIRNKERDGLSSNATVIVDFETPEAKGKRIFLISYIYQERKWQQSSFVSNSLDEWTAIPTSSELITKKQIINTIFNEYQQIQKVKNVRFPQWRAHYKNKNFDDLIDDIENVEYDDNLEQGLCTTTVHLSAESKNISLKEDIQILWEFNTEYLYWEMLSAESISSNLEFIIDTNSMVGSYYILDYETVDGGRGTPLKITEVDKENGIIKGIDGGPEYHWKITGLNRADKVYDSRKNTNSVTRLDDENESLQLKYGTDYSIAVYSQEQAILYVKD